MTKRAVVLLDGGHLRAMAKSFRIRFCAEFVSDFCSMLPQADEEVQKILYYDARPYNGTQKLPISRADHTFTASDEWLNELGEKDLFAVRLGQLKFRGWVPKINNRAANAAPLTDADFKANFEQKGVDMRIGIDMANISNARTYDRILLVSSDSDMVPALKEARKAGIQVALYQLPYVPHRVHRDKLKRELKIHADFTRDATWPAHHIPPPRQNPGANGP